jgi:hypothetical protein
MARTRSPLKPSAAARTAWLDRDDERVRRTTPALAWHLEDACPALAERARDAVPALAPVLSALRARLPVPRRRVPVDDAPFTRLRGHGRAFCVGLGEPPGEDGWVVVKGSEPTCDDFEAWLDEQASRTLRVTAGQVVGFTEDGGVEAAMPLLEKWAVLEGKVPSALTLEEAGTEARRAAEFQEAYAAAHGVAARVPLPLAAWRWPETVVARVRAALEARLSPGAMAAAEAGLRGGLGVYAWWYPEAPVRLAHLVLPDAAETGVEARLERLSELLDWRAAARGWLDLVAEMLALGFLPKSPANVVRGDCLQFQNLVLDGGIADLDSLVRFDEVRGETAFRDALRRTVTELSKGVATLLLGPPGQDPAVLRRLPDVVASVAAELWSRLRRAEASRGLHPRLAAAVRETDWLARVEEGVRRAT